MIDAASIRLLRRLADPADADSGNLLAVTLLAADLLSGGKPGCFSLNAEHAPEPVGPFR